MKPQLASLAVGVLSAVTAFAQPSATMRPALLASVSVETSYSSREDLARGATRLGNLAVQHFGVSFSSRHQVNEASTLLYGVAYQTHELDASGPLPLPDRLAELSLNLGWQQRLSPQWSIAVFARPGLYSDFEQLDSDSLNLPVLALANYAVSRDLIWSFGLTANPFSDNPVIPIVGVRWNFAPQWMFNVGFPQSGFTWKPTEQLALRAGARFQGGSFRITENLGTPAPGIARLANTFVDYREVRVGAGLDYELGDRFTLSFDLGVVTDRKFDYFDRNYRLDGDRGLYGALALKASF
jgi:hypothetical protein